MTEMNAGIQHFWYSYVNEMADLSKWNGNRPRDEQEEKKECEIDELQKP